jgi:hypothetical protein
MFHKLLLIYIPRAERGYLETYTTPLSLVRIIIEYSLASRVLTFDEALNLKPIFAGSLYNV